jgi:GNAT superfamily N-acetyltransferase
MDYYLRPATAVDREWLWQTKSRCMRAYIGQTWGTWDEDAQRTSFNDRFELSEINLIVSGGRDVGFIAALNEPTVIQLFNIMIAPEYQHQGIGTAVLLHLQAVARAPGVPIRLQVLKVNPARPSSSWRKPPRTAAWRGCRPDRQLKVARGLPPTGWLSTFNCTGSLPGKICAAKRLASAAVAIIFPDVRHQDYQLTPRERHRLHWL